ncbi:MAG TPA: histidine kinase, partial [Aquabacterium sp.]|nr:histidine kinase [Aquabacterium sp.]
TGSRPEGAALPSHFDVCHVGVVLRVLVGVQALVCLGSLYGVHTAVEWVSAWAYASAVALPGCLLWLVLVCLLKRVLGRLGGAAQWGAVCALGALAGAYGHAQMALINWWLAGGIVSWWSWAGPVSTGAAVAAVCLAWLRQRQGRALPEQNQARLVELQARIRPHFLFNTLNTAIALVQIDPERAESVLEDLAELFRRALASPATQSTLGEEVDLARRYLGIEQLRFGERLAVKWQLDEQVSPALVPTLLLQPLVENAVRHGVEVAPAGGWVSIATERQGERVVLTISNSLPAGVPLTVPEGRRGHGIALRNVRQRLLLMHDVEAQFEAGPRPLAPGMSQACYVVRCSWPFKELRHDG